MDTKHPEIEVQLSGIDSNTLMMLGKVTKAMRRAGVDESEIDECTHGVFNSGSADEALNVLMSWVDVV